MRRKTHVIAVTACFPIAFGATSGAGWSQDSCDAFERIGPPADVVFASVESVGAEPARGWPERCVVRGTIEGRIRFELHLPAADAWNGKFLMGGGGGFGGVIANQSLSPRLPGGDALQRGYATIGTDTGHRGTGPSPTLDASWAVDNWPALVDFGYRAVYEVAELGKALTMHFVQVARAMFPGGDPERPVLSEGQVKALADAVLAACDAADGLEDGIISDPSGCEFDPRTQSPGFTREEIQAVEAVYGALVVAGRVLHPGYPPGHEAAPGAWDLRITGHARPGGPVNYVATAQFVGSIILNDPTFRLSAAPSIEELLVRSDMVARVIHATSPDLRAFQEAGGRLIMYHGWADYAVSAYTSTEYHRRVVELFGDQDEVDGFFRLFMLPGMSHCSGGDGPDRVDWLTALEEWVEQGQSPDYLLAVKEDEDGSVLLGRPVCVHPRRAHYLGAGDPNGHERFACGDPVRR